MTVAEGVQGRVGSKGPEAYQFIAIRIGQLPTDPDHLLAAFVEARRVALTASVDTYLVSTRTIGGRSVRVLTPDNALSLPEPTDYVFMNKGVIFDISTASPAVAKEVLELS
jgi:hypothetical protein